MLRHFTDAGELYWLRRDIGICHQLPRVFQCATSSESRRGLPSDQSIDHYDSHRKHNIRTAIVKNPCLQNSCASCQSRNIALNEGGEFICDRRELPPAIADVDEPGLPRESTDSLPVGAVYCRLQR